MDEQITKILDGLKYNDGEYKRNLIDQAVELKDEITPHLIQILDGALKNPEKITEDYNRFDHNYALMLLGHFREPKAHKVIVELFSLPGETPYDLFGDTITEDLSTLLLNTCNGSVDLIKTLAMNQDASPYCRVSAADALTYAVVDGIVPRQEILEFLGGLLTGNEAEPDSEFWSFIAVSIFNLYPEESMDTIKKAYDEELINDGVIPYHAFNVALKRGKKKSLAMLKVEKDSKTLDDIHNSMSWWACFENDQPNNFTTKPVPPAKISSKPKTKAKAKKKKKRKLAKKSRRKNR